MYRIQMQDISFYPIYKVNTVLQYTDTCVLSLRQELQGIYHVQCISLPSAPLLNSGTNTNLNLEQAKAKHIL